MMILKNLRVINFKNYKDAVYNPEIGINCIVGPNGSGKTNLLDAIHYISLTKSAFNSVDYQNINRGTAFFSILCEVEMGSGTKRIRCSVEAGKKKVLMVDEKEYEKLSEHIGKFPSVLMAPHHHDIIYDGSETRRRFFDGIIAQLDHEYLEKLLAYNHNLKQRNSLLKYFHDTMKVDHDLIESYNRDLLTHGRYIFEKRKLFLSSFLPIFNKRHQFLSGNNEECVIDYNSQMEGNIELEDLSKYLDRELEVQRTLFGTHRDRWNLKINDQELKKFGSQGQQKTFMLALQLAYFDLLSTSNGVSPFLLLDDIFDRLDDDRIHHLMDLVSKQPFQQIFLTDARPKRTQSILSSLKLDANFVNIINGSIEPV